MVVVLLTVFGFGTFTIAMLERLQIPVCVCVFLYVSGCMYCACIPTY